MSLNPLNELKRRLTDDPTPLPKRLCLAKNIVHSHHFPTAPKERVVADWLQTLTEENKLGGAELRNVIRWLDGEDLTGELKSQLIQVVSQYLKKNPLQENNVQNIISFLEHPNIFTQLCLQIDDFLLITTTLLQYLRNECNFSQTERILNSFIKYYKECKKKLEFIIKFIDGENIETLFTFLDTENRKTAIEVCQNVLFPTNKKSFFVSFLQTLIRKDNIDELIAEKGDNIQSVLKIMSVFFTFPNGRSDKDPTFLSNFVDVFVNCFRNETQMIFAFYIMIVNSLNMNQNYLSPAMKMPIIVFENDEKVKRNLYLSILESLLKNEVDINVRLTDTFGEKISKVEIKKNFTSFLQHVMMGQLKLEGKLDKTTLEIIKTALKLDPILIEQKLDQILPSIMTAKKNNTSTLESYKDMLNCVLDILFKLSRGISFMNQILPNIKLSLEACNTEQFELKQKVKEAIDTGMDCEKIKSKIITGNDLFPKESVELYGKLTSELMFRQNKELLALLQKDIEEYCLMMLEEGFVSPSIITLAEVLSAILSSFLRHCKMADHTVPRQIAEDFWNAFKQFEDECLKKFGECILKLNYNPQLATVFMQLSLSVAHLKLLNVKYSNTKLDMTVTDTSEVFDMSVVLPCLASEQWITLASKISEDEAILLLNNLLLAKTMAINILPIKNLDEQNEPINAIKSFLIKQLSTQPKVLEISGLYNGIFANLDKTQIKQLAKNLVKLRLNNCHVDIFKNNSISNNKPILNAMVLETARTIAKCFENNENVTKALSKSDVNITKFIKQINIREYFEHISLREEQDDIISNCIDILKQLPLSYVDENCQLVGIFILLSTKMCCQKKIRRNIDQILQKVYELTPKYPDIYKLFPLDFIFSFEDSLMINLLTLKIKNTDNMLIIKCILESAVKKVKTESDIVKKIVDILLSKQNKKDNTSSIEYFSDPAFQISCIILPIIAKEKRAITTSAYRSILATLQEKLHNSMLTAFKNIDFGSNSSLLNETNGNTDESVAVSENTLATLNAIGAYSLTLSKYCESNDASEIKNLDCLWSGLEFFVQNAIQSLQNESTNTQHIDSSVQIITVILRHMKKLDTHPIFEQKDQLFIQIWKGLIQRLTVQARTTDEFAVLLKYLCEFTSVEGFSNNFIGDLSGLMELKMPSEITKASIIPHKVSKYLWTQILKANVIGPKCTALSKLMARFCKTLRAWLQEHFIYQNNEMRNEIEGNDVHMMKVDDIVCDLLKVHFDILTEVILAAKKISLDYKFLDSIFCLQHLTHSLVGENKALVRYDVSHAAIFTLFEGCMNVLNALLLSREELLEDRWPCYMQCYRALVQCLCEQATSAVQLERFEEDKLAELAHSVEKLTQSICKRKNHVSRIATYAIADICSLLERMGPTKIVRQHLENCTALLMQSCDSTYTAAFLRRALAGSPGHMTLGNMYTMYKRYHKYVGNS